MHLNSGIKVISAAEHKFSKKWKTIINQKDKICFRNWKEYLYGTDLESLSYFDYIILHE